MKKDDIKEIDDHIKTFDFDGKNRRIKFVMNGMHGHFNYKEGNLKDLLIHIPFLLYPADKFYVPSLTVLNNVLKTGRSGEGELSDCIWEPFEIARDEYDLLLKTFLNDKKVSCQYVEPPDWVKTFMDWGIWMFDYLYGAPSDEHRKLTYELHKLNHQAKKAKEKGDTDQWLTVVKKEQAVSGQIMVFVNKYKKIIK